MSIFNREDAIDKNFTARVKSGTLPPPQSATAISEADTNPAELIGLFESQVFSRHMDLRARLMKEEGKCFYTIGSSGHEGNAVFGNVFPFTDMAFLHYRSGAFFIERSRQVPGSSPLYDLGRSFTASEEDTVSGGRHKVIGSKELNIPPQTSTVASHIPKAVGAALSIDRAKDLDIPERNLKDDSIILCSFGDASVNHAAALSGFNTAGWAVKQGGHVPIVFICEDNNFGISVPTPEGWIRDSFSSKSGFEYIACDGLNILDLIKASKEAEAFCRKNRTPVFLHMKTVRLMGHAGSDIEAGYETGLG